MKKLPLIMTSILLASSAFVVAQTGTRDTSNPGGTGTYTASSSVSSVDYRNRTDGTSTGYDRDGTTGTENRGQTGSGTGNTGQGTGTRSGTGSGTGAGTGSGTTGDSGTGR